MSQRVIAPNPAQLQGQRVSSKLGISRSSSSLTSPVSYQQVRNRVWRTENKRERSKTSTATSTRSEQLHNDQNLVWSSQVPNISTTHNQLTISDTFTYFTKEKSVDKRTSDVRQHSGRVALQLVNLLHIINMKLLIIVCLSMYRRHIDK